MKTWIHIFDITHQEGRAYMKPIIDWKQYPARHIIYAREIIPKTVVLFTECKARNGYSYVISIFTEIRSSQTHYSLIATNILGISRIRTVQLMKVTGIHQKPTSDR